MCQRRPTLECGIVVGWVVTIGAVLALPDPSLFIDRSSSIQRYAVALAFAASCVLVCRHYSGNKNTPRPSLKAMYRAGQLNCVHHPHPDRRSMGGAYLGMITALVTVAFVAIYTGRAVMDPSSEVPAQLAAEPPVIYAELAPSEDAKHEESSGKRHKPRDEGTNADRGTSAGPVTRTSENETEPPESTDAPVPPPSENGGETSDGAAESCAGEKGQPVRNVLRLMLCP